jgi:ribosomal protein S18 acetylase RimI-like enzyme
MRVECEGMILSMEGIELVEQFPTADDYCRLRALAGMSPRTREAAQKGLPNTLYGVSLVRDGEVIGMGRIIGDGGCFYTVVDIAVAPAYQGREQGRRIMDALDAWLRRNVQSSAFVTLVADGDAKHLYAKYGFAESAPAAVNMEYVAPLPGWNRG